MTDITSSANKRTSNNIFANAASPWLRNGFGHATTPTTNSRARNAVNSIFNLGVMAANTVIGGTEGVVNIFATPYLHDSIEAANKYLFSPSSPGYKGSSVTNQSSNSKYKKFGLQTPGSGGAGGSGGAAPKANPGTIPIQSDPDQSYSWNLPPHEWSLPVDPSEINGDISSPTVDSHSLRRGKIFLARKYVGPTATNDPKTSAQTFDRKGTQNYGFQFLWNPETFNQSTSVNWGITPNQNDATAILTGLTNANSTIEFTLRIDRTNDFAAAKVLANNAKNVDQAITFYKDSQAVANEVSKYYKKGQAPKSDTDFATNMNAKIIDLLTRGTEADLEFLYRTINGDGYTSSWGGTTSNISFLLPTIIRLDLGPQRLVGMIQSVNVSHLTFTREMIPIRTDVQLSVDLRAGTGLTTSNFGIDPNAAAAVTTQ